MNNCLDNLCTSFKIYPLFRFKCEYLQVKVSILISPHTNSESDNNSRKCVSHSVVEPHLSVIDVTEFGEHSIEMHRVDQSPREGTKPSVMEADGDKLAGELVRSLAQRISGFQSDQVQKFRNEDAENEILVDAVRVSFSAAYQG